MSLRKEMAILLRNMRTKAKLTQKQVAKKMGTSQPVIARLESGTNNTRYMTAVHYAEACGQRLLLKFTSKTVR